MGRQVRRRRRQRARVRLQQRLPRVLPVRQAGDEGVLFVNHEYPSPFFQHGYRADAAGVAAGKSADDIELERRAVGNSLLHIRQDRKGIWKVVSPSRYNRRVYGGLVDAPQAECSLFAVTGPLAGDARVGTEIAGSLGNCSGGITPWGTAISCEENFDGYGLPLTVTNEFANGWVEAGFPDYHPGTGPYFSPDEQTLFLAVQHPGEATSEPASKIAYGDVVNYTSYWPAGGKSAGRNPSLPRPATVAITRPPRGRWAEGANLIPRPEGFEEHPSHGGHHGHGNSRRDFFKRG